MSCTIQTYKGIPLFITKPLTSLMEDQQVRDGVLISPIPSHICECKANFKQGYCYMKSAFLEPGATFVDIADIPGNYGLLVEFMTFLVRYYVPTYLHYLAWETYNNNPTVDFEGRILAGYKALVSADDRATAMTTCTAILDDLWKALQPLRTPSTDKNIFYPVNKLVGFRVSNLLKRCGVTTLLYPYPLEPLDLQQLRSNAQVEMFYPATFVNVGTRGLKKLASKQDSVIEAGAALRRGDLGNIV